MKDLLILEKKHIVDEIKGLRKEFKLREMEDSKAMAHFHQDKHQSLNHLKRQRRMMNFSAQAADVKINEIDS